MPQDLDDLEAKWNALGRDDPLWAILTHPSKAGGRWSPDEFFATGREEIDGVFAELRRLGVAVGAGTALDFGCGVGRLTQALATRFDRVVGLDVAPSMIELAKAHDRSSGNVAYRVNVSPRLVGVEDDSLDFIYSNIVLQHIPPALSIGYLAEFARVLRPEGVAMFQLPSRPRTWLGRLKTSLKVMLPPSVSGALKTAYRRRRLATMDMYGVPRRDVEALFAANGCEVVAAIDDQAGGPDWISFRYVVRKVPSGEVR